MTLQELLSYHERPLVMAIINATPDSFSGDGLLTTNHNVITKLVREKLCSGMDIIDIGGESTRPGATPISIDEEIKRLSPFVKTIRYHFPSLLISIDTQKPSVAQAMLKLGANIINDVAFGRDKKRDQTMLAVLKKYQKNLTAYIVMHNTASPALLEKNYQLGHSYHAANNKMLITDIENFFSTSLKTISQSGIAKEKIILDVGFGFGKSIADSLKLINHLKRYRVFDAPLLVGVSRKSFVGKLLGRTIKQRLIASSAIETLAIQQGVDIIRVHDVAPAFDVVRVMAAIKQKKCPDYILSFGSNMGDKKKNIRHAIFLLNKIGKVKKISPLYQTAPQYNQQQADFLNGILIFHTNHEPLSLLSELKKIEKKLGRVDSKQRHQPRPIDLDIIAYGEQVLLSKQLTIPHKLAFERAFVLQPLLDIKPWFVFRNVGCYGRDLLPEVLKTQKIKKISDAI
ncbi:MAG: dihydropteroate synthase [Alphaproteobacteria bacterium]